MLPILAPLTLLFAAQSGAPHAVPTPQAPPPTLTLEQSTALRCGVGFAVVGHLQQAGSPEGAKYPPLGERGREFFVRSAARIMDETGADREAIARLAATELDVLVADGTKREAMMPGCLLLLDASGL